jgi:hypothetical protein
MDIQIGFLTCPCAASANQRQGMLETDLHVHLPTESDQSPALSTADKRADWHHTMTLVLFELDKLFIFHVPFLNKFRHGLQLFAGHRCVKKLGSCVLRLVDDDGRCKGQLRLRHATPRQNGRCGGKHFVFVTEEEKG